MTFERPQGGFYYTKEAVKELRISTATLFRRKREGYFVENVHWIRKGPKSKSDLMWNVDACFKTMGRWERPKEVS